MARVEIGTDVSYDMIYQQFKPSFANINLESESTDPSDLSSPTFHNEDNENNDNYFDSTDDAPDYADDLNDEEDTQIVNDPSFTHRL